MKVQAEISIYPLRTKSVSEAVTEFVEIFKGQDLDVSTSAMSTFAVGEAEQLFAGCEKGFERLAEKYDVVLSMKISNACPEVGHG